MTDTNVAQDQIKAYVDRILRMKEEAKAINADIREIYAEAKGNGFDKTVLGQLVSYVEKRQTDATTLAERSALFDLYLEAFDGSSARPSHAHTREGTSKLTYGDHLDEATKAAVDPVAALRADPSMAIVDVVNLHQNPEANTSTDGGATEQDIETPADSVTGEASRASVGAGSDAPIQPETANEAPLVVGDGVAERRLPQASPSNIDPAGTPAETRDGDDQHLPAVVFPETDRSVEASAPGAPVSKYAAPGVVTWETFPPEGVERGAISAAFGWAGQDSVVIAEDLEKGRAQPIVKKGNVILDGWARYMAARAMRELDGSPLAYPVVQYDGTDILVDIIKLNVEGRILTEDQKRKIAANLARQEPDRKDDIYRAFELWMEPV